MRPQKIDDQQLMDSVFAVLRTKGYDGATLNDFAEATGLQKASLYHRFPGGKEEITSCVLDHVHSWIKKNIYDLLVDKAIPPGKRLKSAIRNIDAIYDHGNSICLLRALSFDGAMKSFGVSIKRSMELWVKGFAALGEDCGMRKDVAKEKAQEVLITIQGSLVVSKGIGSTAPFRSVLRSIEDIYRIGKKI